MKYNFKTELNYQRIQEALSDFDSIVVNEVLCATKLLEWIDLYKSLQVIALKDRYFNSCSPGFPCEHTDKNIEYEFSMFYYRLLDVKNWFELNAGSRNSIIELLKSTPYSENELNVLSEYGTSLDEILELNWNENEEKLRLNISPFNYGQVYLKKNELNYIHQLSLVYGKIYE